MALLIVIVVFSLVQSLFGMGLLVFGTPTLLLLGYDYFQALNYLLPASLMVSVLQLIDTGIPKAKDTKVFLIWCLPILIVALGTVVLYEYSLRLNLILAVILVFSAFLTYSQTFNQSIENLINHYPRFWMLTMGFIHGISNLGGSILSIAARAKFYEKKEIRAFIAYCYLCFIFLQIAVLVLSGVFVFHLEVFLFPLIAGAIYLLVGKRIFNIATEEVYRKVFSGFMLLYGIVLGVI